MPEGLVQTVLTPDLHQWVREQAELSGVTVAAWLRRLVMQERQQALVAARIQAGTAGRGHLHLGGFGGSPELLLQRLGILADGVHEFRAFLPEGVPYTSEHFDSSISRFHHLRSKMHDGYFILHGSQDPWDLVDSYADAAADGQIILRLRPDHQRKVPGAAPPQSDGTFAVTPRFDFSDTSKMPRNGITPPLILEISGPARTVFVRFFPQVQGEYVLGSVQRFDANGPFTEDEKVAFAKWFENELLPRWWPSKQSAAQRLEFSWQMQ